MKVFISPQFDSPDQGEGGIRRVVEQQCRWLPEFGVEVVDDILQADVAAGHAVAEINHPNRVVHCHGLYWIDDPLNQKYIDWPTWAKKANRKIIRYMLNAKQVTAPSTWVAQAIRRGTLVDPVVCHHGINVDEWEPEPTGGYVLWNKNRIDPICDPEPLNRLAELAEGVPFVTTFGNPDLENVEVLGRLPYTEMKEVIQRTGVYLATARETGGIGTLEAMAAGVPVLGFDWGGTSDFVIHKETGWLAPVGDYESLLEGLHYCLENRIRLGMAGRGHASREFKWQDAIQNYVPVYEQAAQDYPVKVSVIITAYNLEEHLPDAIESILDQQFGDWELIVVDDASPDGCGKIADEYAKQDPRVTVVHNKTNAYLAEARNIGIRHSSGEFIIALDADDRLHPRALGTLCRSLDQDTSIDIATGSMEVFSPEGDSFVSGWPIENPSYDYQITHRNMVPYASMYRRWVWERTGGYRRRMRSAEDAEFWTRAMSFGAVPAKVTNQPTLLYLNRPNSMSHVNMEPDWTAWFSWSKHEWLTPSGAPGAAEGKTSRPVYSYDPPVVSVVIPVGPGHDFYLQDCIDSLVSQTMRRWEAIVVNDTGISWFDENEQLINPYLAGFPFITVLDSEGPPEGPAAARNRGIEASHTDTFVLLDADDYAQPYMLKLLYEAYMELGGWVYPDWYDQGGELKQAQDWDFKGLLKKMRGPVTGIYPKAAWGRVGGFDEDFETFEDYEFQIAISTAGWCGSRLAVPCFTYRYDTGTVRDKGHNEQVKWLARIYSKHYLTYIECFGKEAAERWKNNLEKRVLAKAD